MKSSVFLLYFRHKLMRACWTFSPGDRISFRAIVEELVSYENEDFRLHAYFHTQPIRKRRSSSVNSSHNDEEELLLMGKVDGNDDTNEHS